MDLHLGQIKVKGAGVFFEDQMKHNNEEYIYFHLCLFQHGAR